jgi:hypothetical protein
MISEWQWIGKDLVGRGRGLILRQYPGICLEGLRKATENLSQQMWSPGPRIEPGPPDYEIGGITTFCRPPDLSANPSSSHLVASKRNGRTEWWIWPCEVFLFILPSDAFICHKTWLHGANGFTFPPKEGVLRIFIALKNPFPLSGLNPRTLSLMTSTLTATPLRRLLLLRTYISSGGWTKDALVAQLGDSLTPSKWTTRTTTCVHCYHDSGMDVARHPSCLRLHVWDTVVSERAWWRHEAMTVWGTIAVECKVLLLCETKQYIMNWTNDITTHLKNTTQFST